MRITKAFALHEIGGRGNQEDNIYPDKEETTGKSGIYLVCDGMGGHEKGEMASRSVCDSFTTYFKKQKPGSIHEAEFERALAYAYDELDKKDTTPPDAKKPGTTLTFFCLNDKGALMAHIGDSRIYHLRKNPAKGTVDILYKSQDHSLVNDLLRAEVITPEEAEVHPERNLVTRIIQANGQKRYKADVMQTTDVAPDDLFFLCSDGVLEQLKDEKLRTIVAENDSPEKIINAIKTLCEGHSRDNFSAWLLETGEEEATETASKVESDTWENKEVVETPDTEEVATITVPKKKKGKGVKIMVLIALLLFLTALAYWLFFGNGIGKQHAGQNEQENRDVQVMTIIK